MDAFHTNLWGESPQKSFLLVKCQRGAFPANSHRGKASISEGTENNIISIISFIPTKRELESWQTSKLKQILAEKKGFPTPSQLCQLLYSSTKQDSKRGNKVDLKLSSVIPSVYFTSSDKSISTKLRELEECIGISLSCLSLCVGHYICAQLTRLQVQSSVLPHISAFQNSKVH